MSTRHVYLPSKHNARRLAYTLAWLQLCCRVTDSLCWRRSVGSHNA